MSSKIYVNDYKPGLNAEIKGVPVRLEGKLELLEEEIWVVYNYNTDKLELVYQYELENMYYYYE